MSDLIDRKTALDGLKYEMKYGAEIDRCGLDTAYDIIEDLPSAEPERTAKVFGEDGDYWHVCADCDRSVDESWKYCPYCGARLEWE